ncbi:MAG TPA: lysozyme inhibitor LprI family protein [Allocoleopsis sp.]
MYKRLINTLIGVALLLVTILASFAVSASEGSNPAVTSSLALVQRVDCSKAESTPEVKYCSQLSYERADKQLNQAYQQVISSLKGEPKQLLITAQQAWIKFRDNNCDFETYLNRGGTGYEIFRNGCLERLTNQRTKDLQDYLSNR